MNIIVTPYKSNSFYFRPDNTLQRDCCKDFFIPNGVNKLTATPILYVKVSKAGKAVSQKFASRYYQSFGYGVMINCHFEGNDDPVMKFYAATSVDNSSIIPMPLWNIEAINGEMTNFSLIINNIEVFKSTENPIDVEEIESQIAVVSKNCSLRIGDLIAFELTSHEIELSQGDSLQAIIGEMNQIDFKIC